MTVMSHYTPLSVRFGWVHIALAGEMGARVVHWDRGALE